MSKVIIAKYKENVEWVKDLPEGFEPIVIDKEKGDLPNLAGREAHTYLHYIYNNYDDLKGHYVFCQGHPFDHCSTFLEDIKELTYFRDYGMDGFECLGNGQPHHPGLLINEFVDKLKLNTREIYQFKPGGQFMVSAERIKRFNKKWYLEALKLAETDPQSGYIFERLWRMLYENPKSI